MKESSLETTVSVRKAGRRVLFLIAVETMVGNAWLIASSQNEYQTLLFCIFKPPTKGQATFEEGHRHGEGRYSS